MPGAAIADTGPLVAYFYRRERHHTWALSQFDTLQPPLLICEPVLTEALFLLRQHRDAMDALLDLVESGVLRVAFNTGEQVADVRALMRKYRDTPMSLADACVVRMAELYGNHSILTLDPDFANYRRFGSEPLQLISPG